MKKSNRIPELLFIFAILIILIITYGSYSVVLHKYSNAPVSGPIEDSCVDAEKVDEMNNKDLYPILEQLVRRVFFKYFRVNYWKECTVWPEDEFLCTASGPNERSSCELCPCDSEEIPAAWRCERDGITDREADIVHEQSTISHTSHAFWTEAIQHELLWTNSDNSDEFVNLLLNPERNTGYGGENAGKIWRSIYSENCFASQSECLEERVFYKLISSIHSSIAIQLSEKFDILSQPPIGDDVAKKKSEAEISQLENDWRFAPNLEMYFQRMGKFPERKLSIYFSWTLILHSIYKARNTLLNPNLYQTGSGEDSRITFEMMKQLIAISEEIHLCSPIFDESNLFQSDRAELREEFAKKFRNVSKIMDCVQCQNCRVHGKLMILGISTALKILLDDQPHLQRTEILALVNTMHKFSEDLIIIHKMERRAQGLAIRRALIVFFASSLVLFVVFKVKNKVNISKYLPTLSTPKPPKEKLKKQ